MEKHVRYNQVPFMSNIENWKLIFFIFASFVFLEGALGSKFCAQISDFLQLSLFSRIPNSQIKSLKY